MRFYDTRGSETGRVAPALLSCTDGYVLVYSTDSRESFQRVELLKKEIDKSKDKKGGVWWNLSGAETVGPGLALGGPERLLFFTLLPGARFETGGRGWKPLPGVFTTRGAHMLRQLSQRGYSSLEIPDLTHDVLTLSLIVVVCSAVKALCSQSGRLGVLLTS